MACYQETATRRARRGIGGLWRLDAARGPGGVVTLLFLLGCLARRVDEVAVDPVAAAVAAGDARWARREEPGQLDAAISAWQEGLGHDPTAAVLHGRLARAEWTRGVIADDAAQAAAHFEAGRQVGLGCLVLRPEVEAQVAQDGWRVTPAAAALVPPADLGCLAWAAVNAVELVRARGPGAAVLLGEIRAVVDRAVALAPDGEGGMVAYAGALVRLLDPLASSAERTAADAFLDRALAVGPDNLWVRVAAAELAGRPVDPTGEDGAWALENGHARARWGSHPGGEAGAAEPDR